MIPMKIALFNRRNGDENVILYLGKITGAVCIVEHVLPKSITRICKKKYWKRTNQMACFGLPVLS